MDDELDLIRSFRRNDVKPNPVARAAARDWLLAHIADGPVPVSSSQIDVGEVGGSARRMSKGNIFICYRREDSSAYAGWLADALGRQFGKDRVLRDVDSQRGVDFRGEVGEAIGSCAVLLALIGPRWLMVQDESGRRRIDHPRDLVALEIAAALQRDIRVIPVLVAGARMLREADLPEQLAGLAYRTAIELSDAGWEHQVSGLVHDLRQVFESRVGTGARAVSGSVRSVAPVPRQNQIAGVPAGRQLPRGRRPRAGARLAERDHSSARGTAVVVGDAIGPSRARLLNDLLPELQRAVSSMQREASFAHRLSLALLQSQVHGLRTRLARDDWRE